MLQNTVPQRELSRKAFITNLSDIVVQELSRREAYIDAQRDFCGVMLAFLSNRDHELIGLMAAFVADEIIPRINTYARMNGERMGIIAALFEWSARSIAQFYVFRIDEGAPRLIRE